MQWKKLELNSVIKLILGPTQIYSKLRQSIPSFSKYLWSLFISGIPIK